MSSGSSIDLSQIPAPGVIETLDFEAILTALVADLTARYPDFAEAVALESDPARKLFEISAYREMLIRARINDAAKGVMLAYATGSDLDQLAAWWNIARRVIGPATGTTPATLESDASLRARTQSAPEGWTCAGSVGAYRWHAMNASPLVLDANPHTPSPGRIAVPVLSTVGDGTADAQLLARVASELNSESVRPLCDRVDVTSAAIIGYSIDAILHISPGPSAELVRAAAREAVDNYCAQAHRIGARVAISGLSAALHRSGIDWVELLEPTADIICRPTAAPYCTGVSIA